MKRKILSILLTLSMMASMVPAMTVSAATESVSASGSSTYYEINSYNWLAVDGIEGGDINFDVESGTIQDSDHTITSAEIPSSINGVDVVMINNKALANRDDLTSISIPAEVGYMGYSALCGLDSLSSITVDADNEIYASVDGVLFTKDMTTLLVYPAAKAATSYTVPSSVTYISDSAFYGNEYLKSVTIPSSVTDIGYYSFAYCDNLTTVNLAETGLDCIDRYAFAWCESLTSISLPSSLTSLGYGAFRYCSSLSSVALPNGLTEINNYVFEGCDSLTSIVIPSTVTSIGYDAFWDCDSLTNVILSEGLLTIDGWAFSNCDSLKEVDIPASVTEIEEYAFAWNYELEVINVTEGSLNYKSVDGVLFNADQTELIQYPTGKTGAYSIPDGVGSLGDDAFTNSAVTSIHIPASVTDIGWNAFDWMYNLEAITVDASNLTYSAVDSVLFNADKTELILYPMDKTGTTYTVPSSVVTIDDYAFSGWGGELETVEISENTTEISEYAFAYSHSLEAINVDASNTNYFSVDGVLFNKDQTELIVYPKGKTDTSYSIPDGVTTIWEDAFAYNQYLQSVSIPSSVETIGNGAFWDCYELTSVTIAEGVETIEGYAFSDCESLESIVIPSTVTTIEYGAFQDCYSLRDVVISEGVESIGESAFSDCDSLESIVIPSTVTSIGADAFGTCDSLTDVVISEGVETIGNYAFYYCESLESLTFPSTITDLGHDIIYGSDAVTSITILSTDVSYNVFSDPFDDVLPTITGYLGSTTYEYAMENNIPFEGLTPTGSHWVTVDGVAGGNLYVNFDEGIIEQAESTVTVATIPSTIYGVEITEIAASSFWAMDGLTSVTIPETVTYIDYTFGGCGNLTEVTILGKTTMIDSDAFQDSDNVVIYGLSGAFAETYAYSYSIPYVVLGTLYVPYERNLDIDSAGGTYYMIDQDTALIYGISDDTTIIDGLDLTEEGLLTGIPMETGDATLYYTVAWSESTWYQSSAGMRILSNTDGNVNVANEISIIIPVSDVITGFQDEIFKIDYDYALFMEFYINGRLLTRDVDYSAEEGSTVITIFAQTFQTEGTGTHTIAATFQTSAEDSTLIVATQNVTVNPDYVDPDYVEPSDTPTSSSSSSSTKSTTVTVPTVEGGTVVLDTKYPKVGKDITATATANEGYMLVSFVVYNSAGTAVECTLNADGTYTFTGVSGGMTIEVLFELLPEDVQFADVPTDVWYYEAVKFVFEQNLFKGTSDNIFEPDTSMSRAMMVTVLYRMSGATATGDVVFDDVSSDLWYSEAVNWAVTNELLQGTGDNLFSPDMDVTREQMAVMFYNYCFYAGIELPAMSDGTYTDGDAVSEYAQDAVEVLYAAGIFNGREDGSFDPQGIASRAEVATVFMRFIQLVESL